MKCNVMNCHLGDGHDDHITLVQQRVVLSVQEDVRRFVLLVVICTSMHLSFPTARATLGQVPPPGYQVLRVVVHVFFSFLLTGWLFWQGLLLEYDVLRTAEP